MLLDKAVFDLMKKKQFCYQLKVLLLRLPEQKKELQGRVAEK